MSDHVEVSITHQIRIGKEDAWVKYGVHSQVEPGESLEKARERVSREVNSGVIKVIEQTVETVNTAVG